MPAGDRQPIDLLMDDDAWAREPARVAEELGHDVYADHGAQERWTCKSCAACVIRVGCNIYGSATQRACPGEGPPGPGWELVTGTRPAGAEWCPWHHGWVHTTVQGNMKVHTTSGGRCGGSGHRDHTGYVVLIAARRGQAGARFAVTGRMSADLVASSHLAANGYQGVTVYRQIGRKP